MGLDSCRCACRLLPAVSGGCAARRMRSLCPLTHLLFLTLPRARRLPRRPPASPAAAPANNAPAPERLVRATSPPRPRGGLRRGGWGG
eukprot:2396843-Pleurochrysis_carterae.AAC.1